MWREVTEDVEDILSMLARALDESRSKRDQLLAEFEQGSASGEPSSWEWAAAAMVIVQCYTGMENVLKRVAKTVDGRLPEGSAWHVDLLRQVANPTGTRPAVISAPLHERLQDCLALRHIARALYSFELDWARLREHLQNLPGLVEDFATELRTFLASMNRERGV